MSLLYPQISIGYSVCDSHRARCLVFNHGEKKIKIPAFCSLPPSIDRQSTNLYSVRSLKVLSMTDRNKVGGIIERVGVRLYVGRAGRAWKEIRGSHLDICGKGIPDSGNSKYKSVGVGVSLAFSRNNSKKARKTGAE